MYRLYDPANMASQSPVSATNGLAVYNVALLDLGDGDVSNARGYTISPCFGATHIPSHSSIFQHSTAQHAKVTFTHDATMPHGFKFQQAQVGLPRAPQERPARCFPTVPVW